MFPCAPTLTRTSRSAATDRGAIHCAAAPRIRERHGTQSFSGSPGKPGDDAFLEWRCAIRFSRHRHVPVRSRVARSLHGGAAPSEASLTETGVATPHLAIGKRRTRGGSARRDRDDPLLPRGTTGWRLDTPPPERRASCARRFAFGTGGRHPFCPGGLGCRVTTRRDLRAARRGAGAR